MKKLDIPTASSSKKNFLLLTLTPVVFLALTFLSTKVFATASPIVHTSSEDFNLGTTDSNIDLDTIVDSIILKYGLLSSDTADEFYDNAQLAQINVDGQGFSSDMFHSRLQVVDNGEVTTGLLNEGYCYPNYLTVSNMRNKNLVTDDTLGWIFIAENTKISILDTKNNIDPTDDEFVEIYSAGTMIMNVTYDETTHIVSFSDMNSGANDSFSTFIDTKGTTTPADDESIQYGFVTTPFVNVFGYTFYNRFLDTYYIGGFSKVFAINNNETPFDISDDVSYYENWDFEGAYNTQTTPAILGQDISLMDYDDSTGYLYIGGSNGLTIIDTKKTSVVSDDTSVLSYPVTADGLMYELSSDKQTLYISKFVYSTKEFTLITINTSTLVDTAETPILGILPSDIMLSSDDAYLYISTGMGTDPFRVMVISTDTMTEVGSYHMDSFSFPPSLGFQSLSILNDTIYGQGSTLCATYTGDTTYFPSSQYQSFAIPISSTAVDISWDETKVAGQDIQLETRTAVGDDYIFVDNFDDGDTSNVGDFYDWGAFFDTVEESNGILTLSDLQNDTYADFWFHTGIDFPIGSKLSVKLRVRNVTGDDSPSIEMFFNEWGSDTAIAKLFDDEWVIISLESTEEFSDFGFDMYAQNGPYEAGIYIEVDWVRVEYADWGAWSAPCTDHTACTVADVTGKDLLQYRFTLDSSADLLSSPSIDSITVDKGYPLDAGTYVSTVLDAEQEVDWGELTIAGTIPSDTEILALTRTGDTATTDETWSEWEPVNSPIASPDARYLQYGLILGTTDSTITPTLDSVTVTYSSEPAVVYTNANLSALTTSAGALTPTFASGTTAYTLSVGYDISQLAFDATAEDSNITGIDLNGTSILSDQLTSNFPLSVGNNVFTITVTAGDGTTTKAYTVTVTRASQSVTPTVPPTTETGTTTTEEGTTEEVLPTETEEDLTKEIGIVPEVNESQGETPSNTTDYDSQQEVTNILQKVFGVVSNADIGTAATKAVLIVSFSSMLVTFLVNTFSVGSTSSLALGGVAAIGTDGEYAGKSTAGKVWTFVATLLFIFGFITSIATLINTPSFLAWIFLLLYLLFIIIYFLVKYKRNSEDGEVEKFQS